MKKMLSYANVRQLVLTFSLLLFITAAYAVPARPGQTRYLTLANGTTISAVLVGDEHGHYWLGSDGRAYQATNGSAFYHAIDKQTVMERAAQRRTAANERRMKRMTAPGKVGQTNPISGEKKGLIILVNFQDKTIGEANEFFTDMANQTGFNATVGGGYQFKGSVYDYFYAQSLHKFQLTFDVVGPVTLSKDYSYYGENDSHGDDKHPGTMVVEALQLVDKDVDFSVYDWDGDKTVEQVYLVYAGQGEADGGADDTIWPHEWSLYAAGYYDDECTGAQTLDGVTIDTYACGSELNGSNYVAGIGTMCHEFSHCLGYPDFYDTDYSGGQGMGYWDLMDGGSYCGDGYQPAGFTSYERWVAGWSEPTELLYTQDVTNMAPLQDSGKSYIIYNKGNKNEYYLLENRQKTGWDASLPGSGLLILHVDYDASAWSSNEVNDDPSHQRMTWVAADNVYQYQVHYGKKYYTFDGMTNDPFPYGSNNSFNKSTTPAAKLFNKNIDGTYYLDSSVEEITQNTDGTISFSFKGLSATPINNTFQLVSSTDDLVADYRYIIACGSKEKAAGKTLTGGYLNDVNVDVDGNTISSNDDVAVFVLEKVTGGWALRNETTNQYLSATAAKKLSYSNTPATWTLGKGTNGVIMTYGDCGTMLYNADSPRFNVYTSDPNVSMIQANLYKGSGAIAYYMPADTKKGSGLKTAMSEIIYNRTELAYDDLWEAFKSTDLRSDGKIWDMYSGISNYDPANSGSTYHSEGDCYNREHSFPQSWFGSGVMPMYSDLHHVYPTDGYVNGMRSNLPFGPNDGELGQSAGGFSKVGLCTYPGYTGKVFEPNDEYKGDFARTYFYMVTCYQEKLNDWYTNNSDSRIALDGNTYPGLSKWQLQMLMEWAKRDPVSDKETARNEAVYTLQKNRNPFIDYPGLEEYIWGDMTEVPFSYDHYVQPVFISFSTSTAQTEVGAEFTEPTLSIMPAGLDVTYSSSQPAVATVDAATGEVTPLSAGTTVIKATFAGNETYYQATASYTLTVTASGYIYEKVTDASTLAAGDEILIAYVSGQDALVMSTTQNNKNRAATSDVTLHADGTLTPGDAAQVITLEKDGSNFLFNTRNGYLYAASSNDNYLRTKTDPDANAKASITISNGDATIKFQGGNTHNLLRYNPNSGNPIFSCYTSSSSQTKLVQIYRKAYVDLTIGPSGYATLYYGTKNLEVPLGVEACTYTVDEAGLQEQAVGNVISAGTAVVLHDTQADNTSSHNYRFALKAANQTATASCLYGYDAAATTAVKDGNSYKYYMLSLNAQSELSSVGFYYGEPNGAPFICQAHKAFLAIPTQRAAGIRAWLLNGQVIGDTTTAIADHSLDRQDSRQLYNLNGQRIDKPSHKGIYIVNGRKVAIK